MESEKVDLNQEIENLKEEVKLALDTIDSDVGLKKYKEDFEIC